MPTPYGEPIPTKEEVIEAFRHLPQYNSRMSKLVPITISKDKSFRVARFRHGQHTWGYIREGHERPYVAVLKHRSWWSKTEPEAVRYEWCATDVMFFRIGHL